MFDMEIAAQEDNILILKSPGEEPMNEFKSFVFTARGGDIIGATVAIFIGEINSVACFDPESHIIYRYAAFRIKPFCTTYVAIFKY